MSPTITARRLADRMAEMGIDQSELARRVGVTPAAINQILAGKTKHSRYLAEISAKVGRSIAFMKGDTDDPSLCDDGLTLSNDEREVIEAMRSMAPAQIVTLIAVARALATSADSSVLHTPALEFRGAKG